MILRKFILGAALVVVAVVGLTGCSQDSTSPETTASGNQFEVSNPDDPLLDDGSGNELVVGSDLALPSDWPAGVPTPTGTLIAVSIIDDRTAVATWSVTGDVFEVQQDFLGEFDTSFEVGPLADLSSATIKVFGAIGNGFDITISATLGEQSTAPGEITLLVNPSI